MVKETLLMTTQREALNGKERACKKTEEGNKREEIMIVT